MKVISSLRTHKLLLVLFTTLLILAVTSLCLMRRKPPVPLPESLFQRIVMSPIPESVRDIRASCPIDRRRDGMSDHTYILRFDISKEDLSKVIVSSNFVEWKVRYYDFCLDYTAPDGVGSGVKLYATSREVPDWFDLRGWKNFAAYYSGVEAHVDMFIKARLLLYNEQFGRAYFVDHEAVGEGPRGWLFPVRR